jgi:hypothetical protein
MAMHAFAMTLQASSPFKKYLFILLLIGQILQSIQHVQRIARR